MSRFLYWMPLASEFNPYIVPQGGSLCTLYDEIKTDMDSCSACDESNALRPFCAFVPFTREDITYTI